MPLGSAADEIARSEKLWNSSNFVALREQQEFDYGLWDGWTFTMPGKEGDWHSHTSTRHKGTGRKVVSLLSQSTRRLYVLTDDETRKKRKSIANTERFAIGCLNIADRELMDNPDGRSIQDALSWYAPNRGGTIVCAYFTEEDGKPIPHVYVYDSYTSQWQGKGWFCYREYQNVWELEDKYGSKIKEQIDISRDGSYSGKADQVLTYLFWDKESWRLAVGDRYIDEDNHGLGYIPVHILPCGAAPPVHSEKYQDNLKSSWQSMWASNRDLPELESKLLSIEITKGFNSGRVMGIALYDSTKSGGNIPEEIGKLMKQRETEKSKDSLVFLDTAKGQEFKGFVEAPDNRIVDQLYQRITGEDALTSIDPISLSLARSGASGSAINEYRSAALEFINPFKKNQEQQFVWVAEELVRQYKAGKFGEVSVGGYDAGRNVYDQKINPEDVEEKQFECALVPDRLRDEAAELGLAIQEVKELGLSLRGALQRHNVVADPDMELEIKEQEVHKAMALTDPINHYLGMADYYKDQGDDRMALLQMELAEDAIREVARRIAGGRMGVQMLGQMGGNGNGQKPLQGYPQPAGAGMQADGLMGEGMPEDTE